MYIHGVGREIPITTDVVVLVPMWTMLAMSMEIIWGLNNSRGVTESYETAVLVPTWFAIIESCWVYSVSPEVKGYGTKLRLAVMSG